MIINPWIFYLINVVNGINVVAVIALLFAAFAAVVTVVPMVVATIDDSIGNPDAFVRVFKASVRIIAVSALIVVMVPNEETILMMQAAKLATPENVNAVFESLKDAVDYVISVIG